MGEEEVKRLAGSERYMALHPGSRWMSFQIEDPKPFRDVLELIKYLEEEGYIPF